MSDPTRAMVDALAPLREALLDASGAAAARDRDEAEREAGQVEDEAAARAAEILVEARRRGEADGADRLDVARAAARRDARAVVLGAQRTAYEDLRRAAVEVVSADLTREEGRERLRSLVADELGPDAALTVGPDGGVRGRAPDGRVVDASADRLVDLALADLDVEGLWSP